MRRSSLSFLMMVLGLVLGLTAAGCGPADDDPSDPGSPVLEADADGDDISDADEGAATLLDTDDDGTPDYLDDDSDGDGIPDYREAGDQDLASAPLDSDGDSLPDFQDTDSDDNGRSDGVDGVEDLDSDGRGNFADLDDDGDGINDVLEIGPSVQMPLDTDNDGTPNFHDTDSDEDTILDRHEGVVDFDGDNRGAYIDNDADGDCVPDRLEAGDLDPDTAPVDSDGDLQRDFLDLDADNDGLLDSLEDENCNGAADPGESSRLAADTDGDGATDLIEQAAGTDPTNAGDNPQAHGDFVFIVPYEDAPTPAQDTLDFATDIVQADVVFAMDTTGSMGEEISNLKSSVASLIGTIRGQIPNSGFGVVGYEDFATGSYGSPGDQPFYLLHRVMTAGTAGGLSSLQARVNQYTAYGGYDSPESGWEMLYQLATGAGVSVGGASVPAFNPGSAYPATPTPGEQLGTIGGAGYRVGSLPIAVWMTDACNHNSSIGYGYNFGGAASRTSAVAALQSISARVIAVVSTPQVGSCGADDARVDALYAVNQTNAVVPPDAWGPAGVRPGNCAVGSCCTGIGGAGESASGGMCPLIFRVNGANGAGLGDSVATAVRVLANYAELDVGGLAVDDPSDAVDAVTAFVERIEANTAGAAPCAAGMSAVDTNSDTVRETFQGVHPGTTVCFDVVPRPNTTVAPLETPQMFRASVVVKGDGVTDLDTRDIFFLVPPVIPDIPIE